MSKLYCATKVLWLYSMIFFGGCSIYSIPGTEPAPVEPEPVYTPVEPVTEATKPELEPAEPEPDTSSAYKGLLNKANSAAARGDYEQALALLERAQRIDPDAAPRAMTRWQPPRQNAECFTAMASCSVRPCVHTYAKAFPRLLTVYFKPFFYCSKTQMLVNASRDIAS
jgi:tetratricopeptide (TPR) repeat protein